MFRDNIGPGLYTSSVAPGSLLNLAPLNKAPTPKLKYGTIYISEVFIKFSECLTPLLKRKAPLLKNFWRRFCCLQFFLRRRKLLSPFTVEAMEFIFNKKWLIANYLVVFTLLRHRYPAVAHIFAHSVHLVLGPKSGCFFAQRWTLLSPVTLLQCRRVILF